MLYGKKLIRLGNDVVYLDGSAIYLTIDPVEDVLRRFSGLTPTETQAITDFVQAEDVAGNWGLIDEFWCFGFDTEAKALTGWKNKTATNNGATKLGDGFGFDGSIAHLDSNFTPSTDRIKITTDSVFAGCFIRSNDDLSGNNVLFSENTDPPDYLDLYQVSSGLHTRMVDSNGADNFGASQGADTLLYSARISYTQKRMYGNGVTLSTFSRDRTGVLPNNHIYIGAKNDGGNASLSWDGTLSSFVIGREGGFDHASHYTNMVTLLTDLGVLP